MSDDQAAADTLRELEAAQHLMTTWVAALDAFDKLITDGADEDKL